MTKDDRELKPIKKIYPIKDIDPPAHAEQPTGGWKDGLPIAIDLGTSQTRAGYAIDIEQGPRHEFASQASKFRDRKISYTYQLVGNDVFLDTTAKQNIRTPFDGTLIQNWDMVETILDYSFANLSVESEGSVNNPIVMSEMVGCPSAQRRSMSELLFECYRVPSAAYGIDSMFSFNYNMRAKNGLVISGGSETTHVIPVVDGKGVLSMAKRINWGGRQSTAYLQSLLALKYPTFPTKLTNSQAAMLMHEHCYVSESFEAEVSTYLDWDGFIDRERVVEAPYVPVTKVEKSEEELARIAEKRKESGRRLQEQAAKARLEKLMEKERNLAYLTDLKERVESGPKKDVKKSLDREGYKDMGQVLKQIGELEKAVRRARKQDVGDEEEVEVPTFPLVDLPDDALNEDEIKEKRKQKLLKANYDARMRAKEEKEVEKLRQAEEAQKEAEWRAQDIEGWTRTKREQLQEIFDKRHEKEKLKEDLANRKSHASQMRMKTLAALANDSNKGKRKRGRNPDDDPDDTFGADDSDWAVYRNVANAEDSEEEEEEERHLQSLQKQLEDHDPTFNIEEFTRHKGAIDWRDSRLNMFFRGPRPLDLESQAQAHQMNLNIERIRVPEVMFQPSIAGVDQAGILELSEDMLLRRWPVPRTDEVTNNIFVTGGLTQFPGLEKRLSNEFRSILPVGSPIRVIKAKNPRSDAWRGMAAWSLTDEFRQSAVTRQEYEEMGSDYIKEHRFGNAHV